MKARSVRKLPALHANGALPWTGERAHARARVHSVSLSFVNSQWVLVGTSLRADKSGETPATLTLIGLKDWDASSSGGEGWEEEGASGTITSDNHTHLTGGNQPEESQASLLRAC